MTDKIIITKLHFDEVVVPTHEGAINSSSLPKPLHRQPVDGKKAWGVQFDELPKLIVTMTLSNGVVGYGEFYRDHDWPTVKNIAQGLIGLAIDDLTLQALPIGLCREHYGFECVIWDAYAKCKGMRVVDLLGGPIRTKVEVSAWSSHRTLEDIGPVAKRFQDMGYKVLKLKADLEDNVPELCARIKEAAPGLKLIFDPNMRWKNLGYVRPLARALEEVGNVLLLEDPMPHWMLMQGADLRKFTSIPIVLHVSPPYEQEGQAIHDAINALMHGAVDGFNFNAGLDSFRQLDGIAAAAGVNCWHGSEIDLGILEAMFIHNACAAKSCVWPSDIFGRLLRQHDLLRTPHRIDAPYAYLPEGPGLGVEVDREAIERYKIGEYTVTQD
ncbi:mandelate racemase/muconate lactonizing enzyme family protein [Pseudoduganella armeniaca]|uniref:glucarate dehydratase n=1 Tax=Pseudoduganella armeniaca TaxID=2072590 RepID=A0A2R4CGX9_9BURK|nr:mandelate racemase/muconate lactonizing enzyme family protein [Pseudoduganella armeniaca]AVR98913.1 mandelate racemase [Pseudoduganella armeniaca]